MDSQANYRLVGGFIVVTSVVIVVALLWLTNLDDVRNKNFYTVYFRKHSLSGLQKDSYVTMKGITIGSVIDYRISPKSIEEIKVTLRLDPDTPVTTTTKAIITRNLLTGLAAVELMGATDGDTLLSKTSESDEPPVIPEGASTFDEIAGSIPELLENVSSLAARAGALFSDKNVALVTSTLEQIETLSRGANKSMASIDSLLKDITSLSKQLHATSVDVSKITRGSTKGVQKVLRELSETLKQAKITFAALETQTNAVGTSLTNTSQVLGQQITTVSQRVGEAAESVSHTAESFENPRTLITGPSEKAFGPGERLPK